MSLEELGAEMDLGQLVEIQAEPGYVYEVRKIERYPEGDIAILDYRGKLRPGIEQTSFRNSTTSAYVDSLTALSPLTALAFVAELDK